MFYELQNTIRIVANSILFIYQLINLIILTKKKRNVKKVLSNHNCYFIKETIKTYETTWYNKNLDKKLIKFE